jgi:hypothetical protein
MGFFVVLFLIALDYLNFFKTNTKQNHFGFYGFELISDIKYGVNYHHCGVVGAQFTHLINNAPWSIEQIAQLNPDLIIFSFGTNEAYNDGLDTSYYKSSIIKFMQDLEIASPKTAFIFTTAPDTRSQNRIPSNQIIVNNILKRIATNGSYSIFDLNEAMGGWGSIYTWYNKGLTLKDKLHFTEQGYSLQGNLFTLSLLEAYNLINFNDPINLKQKWGYNIRLLCKDKISEDRMLQVAKNIQNKNYKPRTIYLKLLQSCQVDNTQNTEEIVTNHLGKRLFKIKYLDRTTNIIINKKLNKDDLKDITLNLKSLLE